MYSLIMKDILIQKKVILLSWVYIIFFIFAMQGSGFVMYPTALAAVTYMLVITACAYDEKNKSDILLNSLPIKRSQIVLAKYLSVAVYIIIGTIAYVVTTNLIALSGFPIRIHPFSFTGLAGGLFSISLITSIYFPVYFKLGYIKSKFLNLILFFTLFFGLTSLMRFISLNDDVEIIKRVVGVSGFLTDIQILSIIIGVSVLLLSASLMISVKVYGNRDF